MAALASLLYPGATAAAGVASQYPLGVPLPGQGTPAAAAAQQQAATQHGTDFNTHAVRLSISGYLSAVLLQRVVFLCTPDMHPRT